jgi:hypothetical protein
MRRPTDGGPPDPPGPLHRMRGAPLGMATDGTRVVVRGSAVTRWLIGLLVGVGALTALTGGIDTFGAVAGTLIIGFFAWLARRARVEFHRDGYVLAAGQRGLRWVTTRPDARIYFFDQFTGKGTVAAVGIVAYDTTHQVDGVSFTKGAKADRLGPLGNFWGAARALRILAAVDLAGCWPPGCWVDLTDAGPVLDPRGRRARHRLEAAGRTLPPTEPEAPR